MAKPTRASWFRPGLALAELGEQLGGLVLGQLDQLGLDLRVQEDRLGRGDQPGAAACAGSSSASSASSTLNTYRNGLAVSRCSSRRSARSIPAAAAPANSVVPPSSTCCAVAAASAARWRCGSLANLASFSSRGSAFSSVCRSARISSVSIVSMSPLGRHLAVDVDHVGVGEDPDDLADRVGLADVGEELVAQALALRRAADQPGDVDEPHGGRARSWPSRTCSASRPAAGRACRRRRRSARSWRTGSSRPARWPWSAR